MRKKSHIALAGFLVQGMDNEVLNHRWKSFYFGNVLPDCKWSFVTMRHEYDGTFEMTAALLKSLAEESGYWSMDTASFVTDLGQVFLSGRLFYVSSQCPLSGEYQRSLHL